MHPAKSQVFDGVIKAEPLTRRIITNWFILPHGLEKGSQEVVGNSGVTHGLDSTLQASVMIEEFHALQQFADLSQKQKDKPRVTGYGEKVQRMIQDNVDW